MLSRSDINLGLLELSYLLFKLGIMIPEKARYNAESVKLGIFIPYTERYNLTSVATLWTFLKSSYIHLKHADFVNISIIDLLSVFNERFRTQLVKSSQIKTQ